MLKVKFAVKNTQKKDIMNAKRIVIFAAAISVTSINAGEHHYTPSPCTLQNFKTLLATRVFKHTKEYPHDSLRFVIARDEDLRKVDISGSSIEEGAFVNTDLSESNLEGVDACYTHFDRSDLRNCSFKNAALWGTVFKTCNLDGADFDGADLKYAVATPGTFDNVRNFDKAKNTDKIKWFVS